MSKSNAALRTGLVVYVAEHALASDRVRWILAEKAIEGAREVVLAAGAVDEDLLVLNPSMELPTLVDRDLVVAGESVVAEYLDERYPYPRLLPDTPQGRARVRMCVNQVQSELDPLLSTLEAVGQRRTQRAIHDALAPLNEYIDGRRWMVGSALSMADIYLATAVRPLLDAGVLSVDTQPALFEYAAAIADRAAYRKVFGPGALVTNDSA